VQNGLNSQSITFSGNLTYGHKITALRNKIMQKAPYCEWTVSLAHPTLVNSVSNADGDTTD